MGADIAEGHITSAPYFQSVANPVNERCVAAYKQRCWRGAGDQPVLGGRLFPDASSWPTPCGRVDSDSVADVLRVLPGSEFAAPQGKVRIDEHNHHTYLRPRIGRINARAPSSTSWRRPGTGSVPILTSFRTRCRTGRARAPAGAAIGGHEEQQRHAAPAAELRSLGVVVFHPRGSGWPGVDRPAPAHRAAR